MYKIVAHYNVCIWILSYMIWSCIYRSIIQWHNGSNLVLKRCFKQATVGQVKCWISPKGLEPIHPCWWTRMGTTLTNSGRKTRHLDRPSDQKNSRVVWKHPTKIHGKHPRKTRTTCSFWDGFKGQKSMIKFWIQKGQLPLTLQRFCFRLLVVFSQWTRSPKASDRHLTGRTTSSGGTLHLKAEGLGDWGMGTDVAKGHGYFGNKARELWLIVFFRRKWMRSQVWLGLLILWVFLH